MYNSRKIEELRADVAENCKIFLELCKQEGLNPLVVATVRDAEYQRYCYEIGTASTSIPSFHSIDAGLAFDICKNVKGSEYSDINFFKRAGEIGKKVGFEWGGDWKSFTDLPHFQWSDHGKFTSSMIRKGQYPPPMPRYINKEEKDLTREETIQLINEVLQSQRFQKLPDIPNSYRPAIEELMNSKALMGRLDPDPNRLDDNILDVSEDYCRVMATLYNYGLIFNPEKIN